jgi:hypothetical protein
VPDQLAAPRAQRGGLRVLPQARALLMHRVAVAATVLVLASSMALQLAAAAAIVDVAPAQAGELAQIVASHSPGTTFRFAPGVYRLTAPLRPKDGDVFEGATSCAPPGPAARPDPMVLGGGDAWRARTNGAEVLTMCETQQHGATAPTVLSGAVLLQNATKDPATGFWKVTGLRHLDSGQHGDCCMTAAQQLCVLGARPACGFPNELFLDGTHLFRRSPSLANMSAMSWYIEYDTPNPTGAMFHYTTGSIYFALPEDASPVGEEQPPPSVEISLVPRLFVAGGMWGAKDSGASNVTVRNLVVEKISSYAQSAAIMTSCSPADEVRGPARTQRACP